MRPGLPYRNTADHGPARREADGEAFRRVHRKYRLLDAVADGTTLQILYEGKTADTALNEKHAFDTKFEDLFSDRTDEELLAIKKKYGETGGHSGSGETHRGHRPGYG